MTLDINKELEELNKIDMEIQSKLKTIREIKPFLGSKSENRDTIVSKIFELARMVNFYPENTTYQTLINSGDMKLIDNFQLRRSIEEHYSNHKNVLQNYQRIEEIHKRHLGNFFIYELDYDKIQKGNMNFLDSKLLKNIMMSIEGSYYLIISGNKKCIESNNVLLENINNELTKNRNNEKNSNFYRTYPIHWN